MSRAGTSTLVVLNYMDAAENTRRTLVKLTVVCERSGGLLGLVVDKPEDRGVSHVLGGYDDRVVLARPHRGRWDSTRPPSMICSCR
jgi:hypothetical protein